MTTFEYTMLYIVSWWLLLLMLLPIGSVTPTEAEGAAYHSAPKRTYLKQKLLGATGLAAIATILISWAIQSEGIAQWVDTYRF